MNDTNILTPDEGTERALVTPQNTGKFDEGTTPKEGEEGFVPPMPPLEEPKVPPTPPEVTPEVDYKKKFGESTRQNQIVVEQFKQLQSVLGDITRQEVPSEEEMRQSDPEWEYLTDREKTMSMKMIVLEKRSNLVLKTIHDISFESENSSKLQNFINGEARLKGKEEDFYAYATKPSNKGASVEVLLGAFLFEVNENTPPVVVPQVNTPEDTPPSLERGSPRGGTPPTQNKDKYSEEELKVLRTTDHKAYQKLIREGKI